MSFTVEKPLKMLNIAVFLQRQKYLIPISFLFYLHNGLTLKDFIFFQSIFYMVNLLMEVPAGYIGDICRRKYVLVFSYLLFLGRILLWIFFSGYFVVLIGEILYGLSKSFERGVSDGYIYDYLKFNKIPETMLKKYGNYNFYMSLGASISSIIGAYLYKLFGFKILLGIELIFTSVSILLLLFIPNVPQAKQNIKSFWEHLKRIISTVKNTLSNSNINMYIFLSAILAGITALFVWDFQPEMKNANLPVILFGFLYFINHLLRALGALFAQNFVSKFSLNKLAFWGWGVYVISFISIFILHKFSTPAICFILLVGICIAIGVQVMFNVATVARIHKFVTSDIRATASSVNSMLIGLSSSLFLMLYKNMLNFTTANTAFFIFFIFLLSCVFIPLKINLEKHNS